MYYHRPMTVLLVLLLALSCVAEARAQAEVDRRCFQETGFCIEGRIREFWERNGGLAAFGFPLREQREEMVEGVLRTVQWFERQRFELHPENEPPYDILIGRIGVERLVQRGVDWQLFDKGGEQPGCRYFEQVQHSICGAFLNAWRSRGIDVDRRPGISEEESLALFGLPISEPMQESIEGRSYTVQWFERARFEEHPENPRPYTVLLGRLGAEMLGDPGVALPEKHLNAIYEAAQANLGVQAGVGSERLAPERVLVYSLPSGSVPSQGVALMLTPRAEFLNLSTSDVAQCDAKATNRLLGGLSVLQPVSLLPDGNPLPIGDYALALDANCQNVNLIGSGGKFAVAVQVERIDLGDNQPYPSESEPVSAAQYGVLQASGAPPPRQLNQPTGLISAIKLCQFVAGDLQSLTSVCAPIATPAQPAIRRAIDVATAELTPETPVESVNAIPDVEGALARGRCAQALQRELPPYTSCTPSLLVAALSGNPTVVRQGDRTTRQVGVIVAQETVVNYVYQDIDLSKSSALLAGNYLVSGVRFDRDPTVAPRVTIARLQFDPSVGQSVFLRSYSNLPLLKPSEQPSQAAIVGFIIFGFCADYSECGTVLTD